MQSHRGPYTVAFDDEGFPRLDLVPPPNAHFLVDQKVASLYAGQLKAVLAGPRVLQIEATEASKSLDRFTVYVEELMRQGVQRGSLLVAIGGGIIQDIACFLAATLLRGLEWHFHPTTLLAQADSCIGSKSSINVGTVKNVLGTFTPPTMIVIDTGVLGTLSQLDVRSGIGEMLKVHAIEGPGSFDRIAADYRKIMHDQTSMRHYIRRSLDIKRTLIEADEFDRGPRQVLNYGHSFGHAIESASGFAVPHGIAVTIGMDMANYTALRFGLLGSGHYGRMHQTLVENYAGFERTDIPLDAFLAAIAKDKKNPGAKLKLILPSAEASISAGVYDNDARFRSVCADYLATERTR